MALPNIDIGLVHKLFGILDTTKSVLTERVTGLITKVSQGGNVGEDALQGILDDLLHHQRQAVDLTAKVTGVKPPTAT